MKLIIAYIQPERLNAVKQALHEREIYKMSVTNAIGCGQQQGYTHMYRGAIEEVTLLKKVRIAVGVNDEYVEKTIDAICEGARTGDIGDGFPAPKWCHTPRSMNSGQLWFPGWVVQLQPTKRAGIPQAR